MMGCGWTRIGSLTIVSTRNIESTIEYKLIAKNVGGISKMKNLDAFQEAIEDAVQQYPEGEFMKNAVVFIRDNGAKIKVVGDVWGIPSVEKNITQKVTADINYNIGDRVAFKNDWEKIIEGTIIGINSNEAMVEYINSRNKKLVRDTYAFDKLTKLKSASSTSPVVISQNNPQMISVKPTKPEKQLYTVNSETLRMREEANANSLVLLTLKKNAEVELIEKTTEEWWKVKYNGMVGYVSSKYLSK